MRHIRSLLSKLPTGLLSGITLAIILWLTLAPHPTGDLDIPLFEGADKVVHLIMFGFLTFVVLLETAKYRKWISLPLPLIGIIAIICACIGIGIEFAQTAMGLGREFEILDILADSAGAIGVGAIWAMVQNTFTEPDNDDN